MKRWLHLSASLSLLTGVLAGTGIFATSSSQLASASSSAIQRGGTLTFDRTTDILGLDPTKVSDNESIWASENIFQTLYLPSADGHSLVPNLATGYTLSSNKLTWTFHLRHGVRFQNGRPMTSADVKFSIQRVSADKANAFAFIDAIISNISTPDKYTVAITTKKPWAPMASDMALYANAIVPNNYDGKSETAFFQHPVGTGPFMVKSWVKGSQLSLVANPYYWQKGLPYLAGVNLVSVPDDNTRQLQLQSGQAQVDEFPPFSSVATLQSAPGITMTLFNSSWTEYMVMNNAVKPFGDKDVRLAINYALDRKAMVNAVLFGHGTVANTLLSPALWAHDSSAKGIQYNLAMAKKYMSESSVPHGFSTTILVGSGNSSEQELGQIVQSELKPLGIKVTLKETNVNTEYATTTAGNYQMGFQYDTTDIIDPDEMTSYSAMGGTTGQQTHTLFTNYNSPSVDKWAQDAEQIFSQSAREALYNKIQVQLAKDAPMAFLYYQPFAYAYSTKVHGLKVYPTGNYPLQNVWLSK
jgi:peptide/nickel transport system substrate-binding protein